MVWHRRGIQCVTQYQRIHGIRCQRQLARKSNRRVLIDITGQFAAEAKHALGLAESPEIEADIPARYQHVITKYLFELGAQQVTQLASQSLPYRFFAVPFHQSVVVRDF